jgi:hypothetical protein
MARMNASNWGAFLQAVPQGAQEEQQMTANDLNNQYRQAAMVHPAQREDIVQGNLAQDDVTDANRLYAQDHPGETNHYAQLPPASGMLFDPVHQKTLQALGYAGDVYQNAKQKLSRFLPGQGQHAMGPPSQATVPGQSNVAASPPGPTSSGPASPGVPGATGAIPRSDNPNAYFADGGALPGRDHGLVRQRKAKPGNIAKPTKAAQAAMNPQLEQPVSAPRNTEPSPSDQDPMLADGGGPRLNIKKAIKHPGALHEQLGVPQGEKIPKGKLDAAAKSGGKLGQRARFAETLSKFSNGGLVPKPKPFPMEAEPKPQPNALEKDVSNDGQRNRLGKTIKRFADGGVPDDPIARAAANRAAKPGSVASSTTNAVNDTTATTPEAGPGLSPAEPAPPGIASRAIGNLRGMANSALGKLYVGAATAAGANDSLHSNLHEYESRGGFAHNDPNDPTLSGKLRNLGVNTYGALTDVSNRIIPGAARAATEAMGNPWDEREGQQQPAAAPAAAAPDQGPPADLNPIDPGQHAHMAIPGRAAAPHAGAPQGPPKPGQINFSNVDTTHDQLPSTTTEEWNKMKASMIYAAAGRGIPLGQAQMMADDQVSSYQHQNFLQYLQQGIALDRAGNKEGAMNALKTAYQYMPTGHDMHFGVDKTTGNIVGYGVDEKTGKPAGVPVLLDQANLNHLASTYSDPREFQKQSLEMQEQARKNLETTQGTVPLQRATATEALQRGQYYQGANQERLEAAGLRADAARAGRGQQDHSLQLQGAIQKAGVMDPDDIMSASIVADQLMRTRGMDQQTAASTAGLMYSPGVDPMRRLQMAQTHGISLPPERPR